MTTRARFLAGAAAAGGAGLAASAGRAQTTSAPATLRVMTAATDTGTPLAYGVKSGLFARAGLDLQITKAASGAGIAPAVIGGSVDIGNTSVTALFEAHDRGVPLMLVAPTVLYDPRSPIGGFIVLKDAPLHNGKDFENQVIGISAIGDIGSIALRAWVDRNGGDSSTLRFAEVTMAAVPAAVEDHRVAAGEMAHPPLGVALDTGKYRAVPAFDAVGTGYAISAWFVTKDFSAKHPELVRAFARAYAESASYCNAHKAETVPLAAEWTGLPAATIARMPRGNYGTVLTPAMLQATIDLAARYGLIKQRFPAQELIDPNI